MKLTVVHIKSGINKKNYEMFDNNPTIDGPVIDGPVIDGPSV